MICAAKIHIVVLCVKTECILLFPLSTSYFYQILSQTGIGASTNGLGKKV